MSPTRARLAISSTILALLIAAVHLASAMASEALLVSAEWLEEHLEDPELVVLHIGREDAYASNGHVAGARRVPFMDLHLRSSGDLNDEFPPIDAMRAVFESIGVGDDSRLVLCPSDGMALMLGGRILLALDMLGLGDNVRWLDGGLPAWIAADLPIATDAPEISPGSITREPVPGFSVDTAWISERLHDRQTLIVDARPEGRYTGDEADGHAKRQGHIAGAVNLPFYQLAREDEPTWLLPRAGLAELFGSAGGAVVVYCGTGIWAGQAYLAARALGLDARFYDGSYQEWSADDSLPVTSPADPSLID